MRTLIYIGTVVLALVTMSNSSCQKDSIGELRTVNFNQDFELTLNDSIFVKATEKEMGIRLEQVTDSRCPDGVQCVWAGNAAARLQLRGLDGTIAFAELCIGSCAVNSGSSDTASVRLGSKDYLIRLKEVRPYPKNGETEKRKSAVLTVSKIY